MTTSVHSTPFPISPTAITAVGEGAPWWNFDPVRTLAELDTLDSAEIVAGYMEYHKGDPQPGLNRGKAYWHGWRNAALDHNEFPQDEASGQLVREVVAAHRVRS